MHFCALMQKPPFFKYLAAFYILLCTAYTTIAQNKSGSDKKGTITGKVLDIVSKSSIEYASIAVYSPASKKPLNGTTSDAHGNFSIAGLDTGGYRVVIDFIGYQADTINTFISAKKLVVKLEDILLSKKS